MIELGMFGMVLELKRCILSKICNTFCVICPTNPESWYPEMWMAVNQKRNSLTPSNCYDAICLSLIERTSSHGFHDGALWFCSLSALAMVPRDRLVLCIGRLTRLAWGFEGRTSAYIGVEAENQSLRSLRSLSNLQRSLGRCLGP